MSERIRHQLVTLRWSPGYAACLLLLSDVGFNLGHPLSLALDNKGCPRCRKVFPGCCIKWCFLHHWPGDRCPTQLFWGVLVAMNKNEQSQTIGLFGILDGFIVSSANCDFEAFKRLKWSRMATWTISKSQKQDCGDKHAPLFPMITINQRIHALFASVRCCWRFNMQTSSKEV